MFVFPLKKKKAGHLRSAEGSAPDRPVWRQKNFDKLWKELVISASGLLWDCYVFVFVNWEVFLFGNSFF